MSSHPSLLPSAAGSELDPAIVDEAIRWSVKLQFGEPGAGELAAFERWRETSAQHETAWQRVLALGERFAGVPGELARHTLERRATRAQVRRRRALKTLALAGGVGVLGWSAQRSASWERLTADYATATGERRTVRLADGTILVLNTDTALNVRFDAGRREVALLRGELAVTTGHDGGGKPLPPFFVCTGFGRLQALGTRFVIRLDDAQARLGVEEGAVRIVLADGTGTVVRSGDVYRFDREHLWRVDPASVDTSGWLDGVIVAHDMPLGRFLAELSRYRSGLLRCDPAIAGLPVSGAFQTADTDKALALVAERLHLSVVYRTRWWVTVNPAA